MIRNDEIVKHDFEARDFSIVQGGGRHNNCFIVTDDNAAISENNRFKNGNLLFYRSLGNIKAGIQPALLTLISVCLL